MLEPSWLFLWPRGLRPFATRPALAADLRDGCVSA